jgi:hypothetical protein
MRTAVDANSTANQAALGRRLAVSLSLAGRMKLLFLRLRWRGNQDSPCALYFHGSRHFPALKQRSELRDGGGVRGDRAVNRNVNEPLLIAARAEINAIVTPSHWAVHFLLSTIPRGGLSGGVAIHEDGDALGVITSALIENEEPEQLGCLAVYQGDCDLPCGKQAIS